MQSPLMRISSALQSASSPPWLLSFFMVACGTRVERKFSHAESPREGKADSVSSSSQPQLLMPLAEGSDRRRTWSGTGS